MLIFDEIMKRLKVKRVPSIGRLMPNHWSLDGTYRILDDKSDISEMAEDIFQWNEKKREKQPFFQHYDAMSAEAAIHNNCVLISDDDDLRFLVNKHFPQRAIQTCELVEKIRSLLGEMR